jgi:hypothetical protein
MRTVVGCVLVLALVTFTGVGLATSTYSDGAGDNNAAPDIASVTVSESPEGVLTVVVGIGNYQALPGTSLLDLWFNLDNNRQTGDEGDEALVEYSASGIVDFYRWNGRDMVRRPATGMAAAFAAGTLTFTGPKSAFDNATSFGVLVVGQRSQKIFDDEFIAADWAPGIGRSPYVAPGPLSFSDPTGDMDAAPDVTSVEVSDTKAGAITFSITTQNVTTLARDTRVDVWLDLDRRTNNGAETIVGLENGRAYALRWDPSEEEFIPVRGSGMRGRSAGGVVTLDVPRGVLDDPHKFGFYVQGADWDPDEETDTAIDLAPNGTAWWTYTLVNKAPVRLIAGTPYGSPAKPRAGKAFAVNVPVRRSDTGRGIVSGRVMCNVIAGGENVQVKGSVSRGVAKCALVVPAGTGVVRGSMTVLSAGKSVTVPFAFRA